MRRSLATVSLSVLALFISGCINPNTPQVIDPTLPKVDELKTISDITEIGFEWEPKHDLRVEGYYLYRAKEAGNNGTLERVATIEDRYVSHYVDTKLEPQTSYIYRMSTFGENKQESNPSPSVTVMTKSTIEPVPFVQAMMDLPKRVKVIWRPHPNERVSSYIVERNDYSSTKWEYLAEVKGRLNAEYMDNKLSDNKAYRYRIKAKTHDGVVSSESQVAEAHTKALPPTVENLQITRDLPKKIVLSWDTSTYSDTVHYKVYRANIASYFYSEIAQTKNTRYEDLISDDGVSRYYHVTAVDKDGLESPRQSVPIMGATLDIPSAPAINVIKEDGRSVMLGWRDTSGRAVKYKITRSSFGDNVNYINIENNTFIDDSVTQGIEYTYVIFATDANGLESKASGKAVIAIPENQVL